MLEFAVPPETFPDRIGNVSQGPRVVAVIPARYQSSRLPGKPLADISGQPMIEHVYRRASEARGIDSVLVATDDERIARAVEQFGGAVRMTRAEHRTGTDRIAEAVSDVACEIVVNVQGDLPLLEPEMLTELVAPLRGDAGVVMSTLCTQASPEDYDNPNVVKVVLDRSGYALYFSRSPLPYLRGAPPDGGPYKHIGLYGYRRDFLLTFAALAQTPLEQAESLEQLRALEHGYRIRTVITRHTTIEVDTPDDLERVRHEPVTR
jgi:3-deoxy-manno-octulosonate cytidylyltransferase (CMP-KDO synthetase)